MILARHVGKALRTVLPRQNLITHDLPRSSMLPKVAAR
jgi:hypothetical protein